MPKHANPEAAAVAVPVKSGATAAAWAVLVGMGGTSVTYNIFHAVNHGRMNLGLALLYGIAPVFAAMCLSHIVAEHASGNAMKLAAFAVMAGAMTLSMGAIASVVAPAAGPWMRWLFGAVLDAAALVALRVILEGRSRKAAAVTALEAARADVASAEAAAAEARAGAGEATGTIGRLEAELATVRAALEAERAKVPPRKPRRSSARKPTRNPATASARNQDGTSAPEPEPGADLDTEAQALDILAKEPEISGSQLGLRLGKSDRYGRDLIKRLAAVAPAAAETGDQGD